MRMQLVAVARTAAALSGAGVRVRAQGDGDAAVAIEWNQLLQNNVPATAGLMTPRYCAMLHVAMFDAANAVERKYTPYSGEIEGSSGASAEAAAAQAARDVLTALIPAGQTTYDAALAARLAATAPGRAQ